MSDTVPPTAAPIDPASAAPEVAKDAAASSSSNGKADEASSAAAAAPAPPPAHKIRHEWYQTDTSIVLDVFIKNVNRETLSVQLAERSVSLSIPLTTGSELAFDLDPLVRPIDPATSKHRVLSTKIELTLAKAEPGQKWSKLEGADESSSSAALSSTSTAKGPSYPTSSRRKTNWDTVVSKHEKEEKQEEDEAWKLPNSGGDRAGNKAFASLFQGATDEQQRAMMKSYTESGGTTLSTNWDEVGKGRVPIRPPEGLVAKKWEK